MEAPRAIVKVVEEITEAAQAAGKNKERCRDIADSARTVRGVLSDPAFHRLGGYAEPRRMAALGKLEATLKDALELIKSQSGVIAFFSGGDADASFQDVENKIRACVRELGFGLTELFVSRRRGLRANRGARTVVPASYGAVNVGQQHDRMAGGRQLPNFAAPSAHSEQLQGYGAINVGQQHDRMAGGRQLPNFAAPFAHSEQLQGYGARPSSFHRNSQSGLPQSSQQQSYRQSSSRSHQNSQSGLPQSSQQSFGAPSAQSSSFHQNSQSGLSQSSQRQSYTAQSSRSHQNSQSGLPQSSQQQSSRSTPQPPSMGQQSSRPAARRS